MIIIGVASRVILGHSGQGRRLRSRMPVVWIILILLFTGMVSRVTAGFMPELRTSHLDYAAIGWILGIGLWAWAILPAVRIPDLEEEKEEA